MLFRECGATGDVIGKLERYKEIFWSSIKWTPTVYAFYAQGHVSNFHPDELEFKPHVECMSIT